MVQTIMSDLGMGEDQSKIDALEQYLEENLSTFFSEDSYMSSVINFVLLSAETETIQTARAILEGLMKRERNATAEHDPGGADAGEPEPEDEAQEEFYDTTPVKSGLAFSFGAGESPLIKAAKEIEDEEKALWEGKTAAIMKSIIR